MVIRTDQSGKRVKFSICESLHSHKMRLVEATVICQYRIDTFDYRMVVVEDNGCPHVLSNSDKMEFINAD